MNAPILPPAKKGNLSILLNSLKNKEGKNLLNNIEVKNLLSLKFKNGEDILTFEDVYFVYEVAWLINEKGYEVVYNFLSADWEKVFGEINLRKKILFENPLLDKAKDKFYRDMDIFKSKVEVSAGEKCPRCQSTETITVEKIIRSLDEMTALSSKCINCGFSWRVQ